MKRFVAMLVVVLAVTPKAEWRYHESTDLMDDSRFVVALSAQVKSSVPADHDPAAILRVGCSPERDEETRGRVIQPSLWATYLNLVGAEGRVRFGDESPATLRVWADGGDDVASLSSPDAWGFVSRLLNADQVLVEIPQYGGNPVFKFPVGDEGRETIRKVIKACDVNEATGRTVWWREGILTLLNEQRIRRPKYADRQQDATFIVDRPPQLNAKTGLVVIPYIYSDSVVAVEVDGKEVAFTSSRKSQFTVPVSSALGGPISITYRTRTSDEATISLYGQYERQYRLSFGVAE